jgi:hypothetical protein
LLTGSVIHRLCERKLRESLKPTAAIADELSYASAKLAGMNWKPNRRWLAFSLRTMFVLVAVFSCWCAYSMNWIRQRHEMLSANEPKGGRSALAAFESGARAPGLLYVFGERGYEVIYRVNPENDSNVERIASLFPEARVETMWSCGPAKAK